MQWKDQVSASLSVLANCRSSLVHDSHTGGCVAWVHHVSAQFSIGAKHVFLCAFEEYMYQFWRNVHMNPLPVYTLWVSILCVCVCVCLLRNESFSDTPVVLSWQALSCFFFSFHLCFCSYFLSTWQKLEPSGNRKLHSENGSFRLINGIFLITDYTGVLGLLWLVPTMARWSWVR